MGIKLYRLARDLERTDEELLERAQQAGCKAKGHLDTLLADEERALRALFGDGRVLAIGPPPEVADIVRTRPEVVREEEALEEETPVPEPEVLPEVEAPPPPEIVYEPAAERELEEEPAPSPEAVPEPAAGEEAETGEPPATEPAALEPAVGPEGVRVYDENPALTLQREGTAVHAPRARRSDLEQEILNKKLELLLHKDRGVTRITHRIKPKPGGGRPGQGFPAKPGAKKDRAQERQEALARIRERRENTAIRQKAIVVNLPITIKDLSQQLGIKASAIIQYLMKEHGTMVTINQHVDRDMVELIALQFEKDVEVRKVRAAEEHLSELESAHAGLRASENLEPRPPVVAILGHVDHGKTSLLDKIRKTNVAAGEAGGITQNISAWQVRWKERDITFIDTPGHEAFTAMRARGAHATDIVVLVVAADDGVMPQTVEALAHAREAKTPIIVALNKVDKPNAQPEKVLQQLSGHGMQPEEWGGDTQVVRTSAITGAGIEDLLETILLVADVHELKANPNMAASGIVLEGEKNEGVGNVATLIVQEGTLEKGDVLLAGLAYGRVRSMVRGMGDSRETIERAGPSTPIEVTGLSDVPDAGDRFYVLPGLGKAKDISDDRVRRAREESMADKEHITLDNIFAIQEAKSLGQVQLIVKADVKGSVEVLRSTLEKLPTEEVKLKIIHAAVGGVNESDVLLADASRAIILAFNVAPDDLARELAEEKKVEIRQYTVIYELLDDVKLAMEGLLAPDLVEEVIGRAEVRATFKASKVGTIAGCYCTQGAIRRTAKARLIRDGKIVHNKLDIDSLRHVKDDVREIKEKFECGIKLKGYEDVKEGDIIEAYEIKEVRRKLGG